MHQDTAYDGIEPIRMFLSSTFKDMGAERDHLVTVVFPELRERLQPINLEFYDIDLRWGVPDREADGEIANSWAYCKRWIDRAQPFFICLLGQRYGWVPPVQELDAPKDRQRWHGLSITEMEVRYAMLERSVSQTRSFFYLRDTKVPPPPQTDQKTYLEFVDPHYRSRLESLKDEIIKSGRPVRRYAPIWCDDHFENLEEFGNLILEDLWSGILRDPRYMPQKVWSAVTAMGQDDLRRLDESEPIDSDLAQRLVEQYKPPSMDAHELQRKLTAIFARRCLMLFHGRSREIAELVSYVRTDNASRSGRFYAILGPPGQGKSALIARVAQDLQKANSDKPSIEVISIFIGAGGTSPVTRSLLLYILTEIHRRGLSANGDNLDRDELEGLDLGRLRYLLAKQLREYKGPSILVILVDGVNQLVDGHDLNWLPAQISPSVRLMLSCIDSSSNEKEPGEAEVLAAFDKRRPAPHVLRLKGLEHEDIRQITISYLEGYCKQLTPDSIDLLCQMKATRSPLYLLVLLRELRRLGGNDLNEAVPRIIRELEHEYPDSVSLFSWVLERLEVFGLESLSRWCAYLLLSRDGLSSIELSDLLERRLGVDQGRNALRIERSLRAYLQSGGERQGFFHGQLALAARMRYGDDGTARPLASVELHRELAEYYKNKWPEGSHHALSELPYHLFSADLWSESVSTLTNFEFLSAKLNAFSPQEILSDCDLALDMNPSGGGTDFDWKSVEKLRSIIRLSADVLAKDPKQLAGHIFGRVGASRSGPIGELTQQALVATKGRWLKPRNPSLIPPEDVERIAMKLPNTYHGERALTFLSNGHLLISGGEGFFIVDAYRGEIIREIACKGSIGYWRLSGSHECIVSVSGSGELNWWDIESGHLLRSDQIPSEILPGIRPIPLPSLRHMKSRQPQVSVICFTPDLNYLVVASPTNKDPVLLVWDLVEGKFCRYLEGHQDLINAVAASSDCKTIVSGADDGRIIQFDIISGRSCVLIAEGKPVIGLRLTMKDRHTLVGLDDDNRHLLAIIETRQDAVSRTLGRIPWKQFGITKDEKRLAAGNTQGQIMVFDLDSDSLPMTLPGHFRSRYASGAPVAAVRFDKKEKWLVSGGMDRRVRVWDSMSGELLHNLHNHEGPVVSVEVGPGDLIASLCNRGGLHIWDLDRVHETGDAEKHDQPVWVLVRGTEPGTVISGSFDATLAVWDVYTGKILYRLMGHEEGRIHDIVVTPGGLAISCSDDESVRVWDLKKQELVHTLSGHTNSVHCAVVTSDESRVFSGSRDGTLRIWSLKTGAPFSVDLNRKHKDWIRAIALSSNERFVASASLDGTVKIWDAQTGRWKQTLHHDSGDVKNLLFLDNKLVTVVDIKRSSGTKVDSQIRVYRYAEKSGFFDPMTAQIYEGPSSGVSAFKAIPSQKCVVCAAYNGCLCVIWLDGSDRTVQYLSEGDTIRNLDVSPDGRMIVTATDGGLDVWHKTGKYQTRFIGDASYVGCLALSDTAFVGSDRSGRVHFFDMVDKNESSLDGPPQHFGSLTKNEKIEV